MGKRLATAVFVVLAFSMMITTDWNQYELFAGVAGAVTANIGLALLVATLVYYVSKYKAKVWGAPADD